MWERVIRAAIWLALLCKVAVAALTLGTNDMSFFRHFGWELLQHGLAHEYRHDPLFNHTPLVGAFSVFATFVSAGSERIFALVLRLPGIAADAAVALALLRRASRRQEPPSAWLLLFALSPVALMVSGFHGNVDSVLAMCLFFAAVSAERDRPVASGIWLALACNVKVAALLVAPVFFFHWFARGQTRRFFITAAGGILLGWAPALLVAPIDFLRQVLGYAGYWGIWGLTWLLKLTGKPEFQTIDANGLVPIQSLIMQVLKAGLMFGALAVAWIRRRDPIWDPLVLVWAIFMVAASGVAAQYLVWPLAALFVFSRPGWAVVEATSAIFLFVFYTTLSTGLPWYYGEANAIVNERWLPWGSVAWAGWIAFLTLFAWRQSSRTPCLSPAHS